MARPERSPQITYLPDWQMTPGDTDCSARRDNADARAAVHREALNFG